MLTVETTALIRAPLEKVWDALNDIDHTHEWVVGLERAERNTGGVYGAGSVYTDYNRIGPFLQVTSWHVAAFEPIRYQKHVSDSTALPSTLRFTLSSEPDGARVWMHVEMQFLPQLGVLGRLLERLVMRRAVHHVTAQNLANLAAYLAARAEPNKKTALVQRAYPEQLSVP